MAAFAGKADVARLLVENGAEADAETVLGVTPLHVAVGGARPPVYALAPPRPSEELIRLLAVELRADVTRRDSRGATVLHGAVAARWLNERGESVPTDPAVLRLLIRQGAWRSVDAPDADGRTPLHWAAETGNAAAVELLVEQGARPDVADARGWTSLHLAAFNGHADAATPLMRDLDSRDVWVHIGLGWKGRLAKDLLDAGQPVNVRHPGGWTPLLWALHRGHGDIAFMLLKRGADPNAAGDDGTTPLHLAVWCGVDIASLLARGADPNAASVGGETPLIAAAGSLRHQLVRWLLRAGANVDAKDDQGTTALDAAVGASARGGDEQVALEVLGALMAAGPAQETLDGAMRRAGRGTSPEVVRRLARHGADPNAGAGTAWTAMHYAASEGRVDVMEALLKAGGDANATNANGDTVLHQAVVALHEKPEVITLLLEYGADLTAKFREDKTPVERAEFNGKHQVAAAIREFERKAAEERKAVGKQLAEETSAE